MASAVELTAERLREVVDYDPATGAFTRKVRLAHRHHVGDRADFLINKGPMTGYARVSIDSKRYLAHRVAWFYIYGVWPGQFIDHINGVKSDNRISNLRLATATLNQENTRVPKAHNKCGYLGVVAHQSRWRATLRVNKKRVDLGCFDTPEEAHAAYVEAKRKYHKGCTI
jgi:hypothetical protein